MLRLSADPINAPDLLRGFEEEIGHAGGIVSFTGQVRSQSNQGAVKALRLQSYAPMTENGIAAAMADADARWPLQKAWVHHRIGEIQAGDTIVFVATASAHRRAAFEAADFLMDYLKTEAVFWKQEITEHGAQWIEPRAEDYTDASRWAEKGS